MGEQVQYFRPPTEEGLRMSLRLKPFFTEAQLFSKSEEDLKKDFYSVFTTDFITTPFLVNGKAIKLAPTNSDIPGFETYNETYAHIVTRELKSQRERFFDLCRANRIHWVKVILTSHPSADIRFFKWKDERGVCKQYFWYYEHNFIVVLKNISDKVSIVTAFCIDGEEERLQYRDWFDQYESGKSGCK